VYVCPATTVVSISKVSLVTSEPLATCAPSRSNANPRGLLLSENLSLSHTSWHCISSALKLTEETCGGGQVGQGLSFLQVQNVQIIPIITTEKNGKWLIDIYLKTE
jgi:hypothetical protein